MKIQDLVLRMEDFLNSEEDYLQINRTEALSICNAWYGGVLEDDKFK